MNIVISKNQNSTIQGLKNKEMSQLKNYKKILISAILIFGIIAIFQYLSGEGIGFIKLLPIIIGVCFGICSMASFARDETVKADRYIKSLPIKTKDIISAKYSFVIGITVIGGVIGAVLEFIICIFFIQDTLMIDFNFIVTIIESIVFVFIIEAIQIPCIYKFGVEKARIQIFIIIAILIPSIALMIGGILYWLEKIHIEIQMIEPFIPPISVGLMAIFYNISYKTSCKIYDKKEF